MTGRVKTASGTVPVLVIGAGQAGLATGHHLKSAGIAFRIVDAHERVGDNWRRRYASLRLFTPRWMNALPGLTDTGPSDAYPTASQFADYLQRYAQALAIPVEGGLRVSRLARGTDGLFHAKTSSGETIRAEKVVISTGGFQRPIVPALATGFDGCVATLSADGYDSPAQIDPGTVLVVGDGASGRDIAMELAATHPCCWRPGGRGSSCRKESWAGARGGGFRVSASCARRPAR